MRSGEQLTSQVVAQQVAEGQSVTCKHNGYVQEIDRGGLLAAALRTDTMIRLPAFGTTGDGVGRANGAHFRGEWRRCVISQFGIKKCAKGRTFAERKATLREAQLSLNHLVGLKMSKGVRVAGGCEARRFQNGFRRMSPTHHQVRRRCLWARVRRL